MRPPAARKKERPNERREKQGPWLCHARQGENEVAGFQDSGGVVSKRSVMPYIHNPHTGLPEWFDQSAIDLFEHIKATARKLTEGARAMCPPARPETPVA